MPHDQQPSGLQLSDEPVGEVEIFEASQIPTLVVKVHGHPADRMPEVFDAVFRAIFPAMGRHGLTPAGPRSACTTGCPTRRPTSRSGSRSAARPRPSSTPRGPALRAVVAAGRTGRPHLAPRRLRAAGCGVDRIPGGRVGRRGDARAPVLGGLRDGAPPGHGPRRAAHRSVHARRLSRAPRSAAGSATSRAPFTDR